MPLLSPAVNKNMWRREQSGLYAPVTRRNFSVNGLVFYAPLWNSQLSGSPFSAWDVANGGVYSCTVTGAVWGSQGRSFDGTDDVINCGSPTSLDALTGNMTIATWIKPASYGEAAEGSRGRVADKTGTQTRGFNLYLMTNETIAFGIVVGGVAKAASAPDNSVPFGSWAHVVGVFNGSNVLIYVNTSVTTGGATVGPTDDHSADDLLIGDRSSSDKCYDGIIGEVRIYNRALSAGEVLQNYLATKWRYQ